MKPLLIFLLLSTQVYADEKTKQLECAYRGNIASTTQFVRLVTGDNWEQFKSKASKMFKDDDGLMEALGFAHMTYLMCPSKFTPSQAFALEFERCLNEDNI